MKKRALTIQGEAINKRLIELNMTQRELAEIIGTSEVYLSMILRGERAGYKYIDKIVATLQIRKINHIL